MARNASLIVGAALIGGLLLLSRRAQAQPLPDGAQLPADMPSPEDAAPTAQAVAEEAQQSGDPLGAFLRAIRIAETGRDDGYGIVYGGGSFSDFSNHPAITGEWEGKALPDAFCTAAGFGPGCKSTAAGAYQINLPTWIDLNLNWQWVPLGDFSPDSQDQAAIRILDHDGALQLLDAGDVVGAVRVASRRWASLPGSTAGQGSKSLAWFMTQFAQGMQA